MTVYMEVTNDEYELPLAVADSAQRLAELRGVSRWTVFSGIQKERKGMCKSRYKRVEIEDD